MDTQLDYYAIVIGSGMAGIEVAKGLATAGKKVLLVDKGPHSREDSTFCMLATKALIASSTVAHEVWRSSLYGIDMRISNFQSNRALVRVREIMDELESHNSPQALRTLGIHTYFGQPSFLDPYTVQVIDPSGQAVKFGAKYIVIATGSVPVIPTISGLDVVPYFTKDTIFSLEQIPSSLAIIGGGETGCELAQAMRRLGSSVILIEQRDYVLKNEEPEAYKAVQSALVKEGVEIYLGHQVTRVTKENGKIGINVRRKTDEKEYELHVDLLLLATGRKPKLSDLNLDKAHVDFTEQAISHDDYGRTSMAHIWVVGDARGLAYSSHASINQAHTVLKNLLSTKSPQIKMDTNQHIPRVFYTDPEVASIGLTEEEAIQQYGAHGISIYTVPLKESEWAVCEGRTDGFVKFVTKRKSSQILGATVVSPIAADMILEISCAMKNGCPLRKLANIIHPYPTYSQIIYKAADKCLSDYISPFISRIFGRFFS